MPNYRRDIDRARELVATGCQIVATRCGPIEHAVSGDGAPVLIVHGAGGGFDQGLDIGAPLARMGLRVIAMSRFGYLGTPLPADASAAAQADAHACLLDALQIPRAAIVGASAGAPSSLQLALRHPHRCSALVLLVPAVFVPGTGSAAVQPSAATRLLFNTVFKSDFLLWAAIKYARATLIRAVLATPPAIVEHAIAQEQARVEQTLQHMLPISLRRLGLVNDVAVISGLQQYDLEQIAIPTLVMSAADDLFGTFEGARYAAAHIPGARFIGYPDGGHLCVGRQDEAMSEIAAFLTVHNKH
jgi:pimeloyl-ACP methyl ester carboxylesterase